jgi:hypothetical protein
MKKLLLVILSVVVVSSAFAGIGDFDRKGMISGWKFAPVQLGLGFENYSKLVDDQSNVIFNIGLWEMDQRSAVFSLAGLSELKSNYGISLALANWAHACYGIQIGFLNTSERFQPAGGSGGFTLRYIHAQAAGINIADVIQIGLLNIDGNPGWFQMGLVNFCGHESDFMQLGLVNLGGDKLKIGVVNVAEKGICNIGLLNFGLSNFGEKSFVDIGIFNHGTSTIQLGLLNYNPKSYIPWLPFVNWDMGREVEK